MVPEKDFRSSSKMSEFASNQLTRMKSEFRSKISVLESSKFDNRFLAGN